MEFDFDEIEQMVQRTAYQFAVKELAPRAEQADCDKDYCRKSIDLLRRNGYLGIMIPDEYEGEGMSSFHYILAVEQMARACLSTAAILGAHNLAVYCIKLMGNDEQKEKYFPSMAGGEHLGAFALTEADTGSDVSAITSTAVKQNGHYVINGTKRFITNGGVANLVVVFAKTDRSQGHRGISAFIVEKEAHGFTVAREENKMGIRGTSTGELVFDNCRVPAENLLGEEGAGFKLAMMVLDCARPSIGAQAIGLSQAALDLSMAYARDRVVFGQAVKEYQTIKFYFADMATRLEAARLMTYKAARLAEKGTGRFSKESAMAKLYATETAHFIVDRALQIHGGYGYMKEYPIERLYRDQRILEIYEGTSEIQRLIISGHLLK
ncbi:MAG: acyl-CoA dehydrogenase family protein [Anaerolineales bacterium]|nr:acyl-CoA dehydrogenase family protein [Anaerolineales bacterium]